MDVEVSGGPKEQKIRPNPTESDQIKPKNEDEGAH
jgi:hypothetical protein